MRLPIAFLLAATLVSAGRPASAEEEGPSVPTLPRHCGVCHLDRVRPRTGVFNFLSLRTQDRAGSRGMCYSCHNGPVNDSRRAIWTGRQHQAGDPSGQLERGGGASCGTCHDPHVQTGGARAFMRFPAGYTRHCQTCHPDRKGERAGEHPSPGGDLSCGSCHQVHRAPAVSLTKPGMDGPACSSCHGDNPSREGTGPGMSSHSTGGESPSCGSCHRSHKAPGSHLVRQDVVDGGLCRRCHTAKVSEETGGTNHPFRKDRVLCLSCHRAHNAVDMKFRPVLLAAALPDLNGLCSGCHSAVLDNRSEWNHPIGVRPPEDDKEKTSKLIEYGGLQGQGGEILCLTCHRSHQGHSGTSQLVVGRQALCLYCHGEQNSLATDSALSGTHPVSVKPSKASISPRIVEAGGSQGRGGEITCVTCHRVHHGVQGTKGLVLSSDEYSCSLCHTEESAIASTSHGSAGEGGGDPCLSCHGPHGWSIPIEQVELGVGVIEKICWFCHGPSGSSPKSALFGHTIGVTPRGGTGGRDLPLFWEDGRRLARGILTCATCHDVHRNPDGKFLRLEPKEKRSDLCLGCHRRQEAVSGTKHDISLYFPAEKNRNGESSAETGPCGVCHLVHSNGPEDMWARDISAPAEQALPLDSFCRDCHREGNFAQGKVVEEGGHPTPEALSGRENSEAVDCDGCHDPHQWNPSDPSDRGDFFTDGTGNNSFLVAPASEGSRLCLRCHESQGAVAGTKHDIPSGAGKDQPAQGEGTLCGRCHLPHGGDSLLMWSSPLGKKEGYGSEACRSCHAEGESSQAGDSHPLGVNPGPGAGVEIPLFLPDGRRSPRGKVSCSSCHDPHVWSPGGQEGLVASSRPGPSTSFLRLPADGFSPLCLPCHFKRSMVVGTDHDLRVTAPLAINSRGLTAQESGVCGSCHRVHGASSQPGLWGRSLGKGEDPQSRYCRSCHEEKNDTGAKVPPRLEVHFVQYPGKGMVSRFFTRRASSILDLATSFPLYTLEGKTSDRGVISCVTCHDAHLWEPDVQRSGTGMPLEGDLKSSFLKARSTFAIGRSFCQDCHGEDVLEFYQRYHVPPGKPGGETP